VNSNSELPEFWNERYQAGRAPWDQAGVPSALADYLRRCPSAGTVLIPGCGSGYEVKAFHDAGWKPTAIDFSPAAVDRARALLGPLGAAVHRADFFGRELRGPFDLVYERTFLCSLPPERWPAYAERVSALLNPNGRVAGLFVYGEETEPPPFPLTVSVAATVFAKFALIEDIPIPAENSLPLFAGRERWQVWQLRALSRHL
jgi:SAM-dependent methyltransferase